MTIINQFDTNKWLSNGFNFGSLKKISSSNSTYSSNQFSFVSTCTEQYRYGYNGQERDKEIRENLMSAEFWEYDARTARRWNPDPGARTEISDYACFYNNPILLNDPDGDLPGAGDPPLEKGKEEGQRAQTQYLPACKECIEYKTEDWIWHEGGVNGSEARWMSPSDYQKEVLNPLADAYNASKENSADMDSWGKYLGFATSRNGSTDWFSVIKGYAQYRSENPTVEGWQSWVPIWGSAKQAYLDYSVGKGGWGTMNSVLAISDVFLVKALFWNVGKAAIKVGFTEGVTKYFGIGMSHEFGASVSRWKTLGLDVSGYKHHWFISQELMEKYPAMKVIGNQRWNLTKFSSQSSHMRWAHGKAYPSLGLGKIPGYKAFYLFSSTPNGFKFGILPQLLRTTDNTNH